MSTTLRLVAVLPTEEVLLLHQRRQGWWLLVARISAGKTQGDAGQSLGIQASSYGDFERGVTAPSMRQLQILAAFFEIPLSVLTEPDQTDEERLEEKIGRTSLRSAMADAIDRIRRSVIA